jgi:hypothetical protein
VCEPWDSILAKEEGRAVPSSRTERARDSYLRI